MSEKHSSSKNWYESWAAFGVNLTIGAVQIILFRDDNSALTDGPKCKYLTAYYVGGGHEVDKLSNTLPVRIKHSTILMERNLEDSRKIIYEFSF